MELCDVSSRADVELFPLSHPLFGFTLEHVLLNASTGAWRWITFSAVLDFEHLDAMLN